MGNGRGILVLGFGNPGRLDDGLGPAFIQRVEALCLEDVSVDCNYQLAPEDAATLSGFAYVLFVDADVGCQPPFRISRVKPEHHEGFTSHSVSPGRVLGLAQQLFSADTEAFLLGIRGYNFNEFGERLSDDARANLERALEYVAPYLREKSLSGIVSGGCDASALHDTAAFNGGHP